MREPEIVARELDALAEQQTGPERQELREYAAAIRTDVKHLNFLLKLSDTRMAEICAAAVNAPGDRSSDLTIMAPRRPAPPERGYEG